MKRAKDMGYDVLSAVEFEFFLFDETPHSVRARRSTRSRRTYIG
jgi:glutamine synthetase